jgi:diguanylate cyclase (GGDEF)-like protein/PAS domain S-box-containing protein
MRARRLSPVWRVSLALTAIALGLLVALDLALDLMPSRSQIALKVRQQVSGALAVQVATLVADSDVRRLERTLSAIAERNPEIGSIGVRHRNGELVAQTGYHLRLWLPDHEDGSTLTYARIPLQTADGLWGHVEIAFLPVHDGAGWREVPLLTAAVSFGTCGIVLFSLYVRRTLQTLNPSRAIPERVREAFDTLPDGVAVLNHLGRVVLANKAFRRLHPHARRDIAGEALSAQPWLEAALTPDAASHPWSRCLAGQASARDQLIQIPQPSGPPVLVLVNCAPIGDGTGPLRGCVVTFDDVSDVQRANERLKVALAQLELTRKKVERQNKQLHHLATRDALTGCLNRRAFFSEAELLFAQAAANGQPLACIMTDIDRFKSINDRFGHPVGDEVIKSVAAILGDGLREHDLLGRYGGEEFCIVLPDSSVEQAQRVAQRLREQVERKGNANVRASERPTVTSSFGVAVLAAEDADLAALIERADQALYAAKEGGRNRVVVAPPLGIPGQRAASA